MKGLTGVCRSSFFGVHLTVLHHFYMGPPASKHPHLLFRVGLGDHSCPCSQATQPLCSLAKACSPLQQARTAFHLDIKVHKICSVRETSRDVISMAQGRSYIPPMALHLRRQKPCPTVYYPEVEAANKDASGLVVWPHHVIWANPYSLREEGVRAAQCSKTVTCADHTNSHLLCNSTVAQPLSSKDHGHHVMRQKLLQI